MNAILLTLLLSAPNCECFVFLKPECPMAKLYAPRLNELATRYPQVKFRGVCANSDESNEFQNRLVFDCGTDRELVQRLGARRSPEAFLVRDGSVVYHGRIDDQYTPGTNRSQPTRNDLEEAIKEVLAGNPVSVSMTQATGCHLLAPKVKSNVVTFEDVAPILHAKCAGCHRPGEVAPFSLLTYQDTVGWASTIREVISENRMPPWHAEGGHFTNDRSLTMVERALLLRWVEFGAPAGAREPKAPVFQSGWTIRPDLILEMEQPFDVPAEGVIDIQEFALNPGFTHDTWIQAIEFDPGCRAVVHHINIFLRPKGAPSGSTFYNDLLDQWFGTMVPGTTDTTWSPGLAKIIPAGWDLVLNVHYMPNGTPQKDRTRLALQLADVSTVRQKIATRAIIKEDFVIPPNSVSTFTNEWIVEEDYTLHAMMAHMHYRGRSMKITADGEVLLNIPRFDFNWQHRYALAQPKQLKRGTKVVVTAVFDNTDSNPNNPDPNTAVRNGKLSTDEMMHSYFDITRTAEDRITTQAREQFSYLGSAGILCLVLAASVFSRRNR